VIEWFWWAFVQAKKKHGISVKAVNFLNEVSYVQSYLDKDMLRQLAYTCIIKEKLCYY